jgi:GNAT superfamily N-acetyltransferase
MMLRDGVALIVRAIRPEDIRRLRVFHSCLSLQTIYLRFFTMLPVFPLELAERLTHMDAEGPMVLAATTGVGGDEQIVAVVRYEHSGPTASEVALVVEDCWQGRGIATALLHRLAKYARACGSVELVAQTMGWNTGCIPYCGIAAFRKSRTLPAALPQCSSIFPVLPPLPALGSRRHGIIMID